MNPEIKAQWVAALRSGEYMQGDGKLHRAYSDGTEEYCCLGVLSSLAADAGVCTLEQGIYWYEYDGRENYPPQSVVEWAGLEKANPEAGGIYLTHWNDEGKTFEEIADQIDEYL